ncbi:hypothetical protein M5W76_22075, partial [Paenibacillus larvae]|uniref:hypothetical protein n=1 Tax=Paenibacillus larvae TaxID=1464 RepID=UPI002280F19D
SEERRIADQSERETSGYSLKQMSYAKRHGFFISCRLGPSRHAYAPIPDAMHKRKSVRPALRKEVTSITLRGIDVSIRYFADRK